MSGSSSLCQGESYYLEMRREAEFGYLDMTLALVPEPGAVGDSSMETKTEDRTDSDLGSAVTPGEEKVAEPLSQPDLSAAPVSGTVVSEIVPGETQYIPVEVGWGQALNVAWEVLEDPAAETMSQNDQTRRGFDFSIQNSLLQPQDLVGEDFTLVIFGDPVLFGTKRAISYANVGENNAWLGGKHFVQVSFTLRDSNLTAASENLPIKYRITVTPVGEAVTGPTFAGPPQAVASESSAAPASDEPQAQAEEESGGSSVLWAVLGIVVVLIAMIVAVVVRLAKQSKRTTSL